MKVARATGAFVGGLATLVVIAAPVSARSMPAASVPYLGSPGFNCYSIDYNVGWLDNSCPTSNGLTPYEAAIPLDRFGAQSLTITVDTPDPFDTTCFAEVFNQSGVQTSSSNFFSPTVANQPTDFVVNGFSVPTGGYAFLQCSLPGSTSIIKVDYQ